MQDAFFKATQNSLATLTSLCDIVHPLTVSMWNTRSQVIGTYAVNPSVNPHQIAVKYGLGSGIHGVNYKRVFKDTPWETHKENIAWLFLNSLFPIYEGWLDALYNQAFPDTNGDLAVLSMQFPSPRPKGDIITEINRLTSIESPITKNAFYSGYASMKHRDFTKLNHFMICFRYFKEMRNCYMHSNGIANIYLINAYNSFNTITNPADFNMSEIPKHYMPILGEKIKLSLRGVIGFSHILLQIILTVDSELLRSKFAEKELLQRLLEGTPTPITINSYRSRASRQIQGLFKSAGFITPNVSSADLIIRFLIDNHLIYPVVLR